MVLLDSCLQACMTYTIAECTLNKLLMMDRGAVRNIRVSCQNKLVELVHLVGFIIKKSTKKNLRPVLKTLKSLKFLLFVFFGSDTSTIENAPQNLSLSLHFGLQQNYFRRHILKNSRKLHLNEWKYFLEPITNLLSFVFSLTSEH